MSDAPELAVVNAIEAGTSVVTRRVEIYEADGVTLWNPTPDLDPNFARLVDGSVSVDQTRDERRTLDLTLLNEDKLLRPNALGGLWYDKVIKVFRGITYSVAATPPAIALVEHVDGGSAPYQFRSMLNALGFTRTDVRIGVTDVSALSAYDIVMSYTKSTGTALSKLLLDSYNSGKSVVTIGTANDASDLPFVTATTPTSAGMQWGITPLVTDNPLAGSFTSETDAGVYGGAVITAIDYTAQRVAQYTGGGYTNYVTGIVATNVLGGRWFDLHLGRVVGPQAMKLLKAGIEWTRNYLPTETWETQLGEFCIDNIVENDFPFQVKITGRDYTKRCLNSLFPQAVTFVVGTSLFDLIKALAINSGCTKFKLPSMTETLTAEISADRGTDRWSIMKSAADSYGYEIFFDTQGSLTMRKYLDPSFSPTTATFKTGKNGNLVSFERSVNDSRLFNHIIVWGDPGDGEEDRLPYFGEAVNTEPSSPTRIDRIGDRVYTFSSTFMTSDQQCADLALAWLKINSLESYELNSGAIYYPWLEAGEIVNIFDPDRLVIDPTRFLMDTIQYPLGLGPMSFTAKRVTYVGVGDPYQIDNPTGAVVTPPDIPNVPGGDSDGLTPDAVDVGTYLITVPGLFIQDTGDVGTFIIAPGSTMVEDSPGSGIYNVT